MDLSILPLRSFALLPLLGLLAQEPSSRGVHEADGPSVDGSTPRDGAHSADLPMTENWYRFFCGPGWDPDNTTPCGQYGNGDTYHGCANSVNSHGARLTVLSGDSAVDDVVLMAFGERSSSLSIVLQGATHSLPGLPFGDGVRCLTGSPRRLYTHQAVDGVIIAPRITEPSIRTRSAALGDPIPSPAMRYYQVWYRDGPSGFNITSGIRIDWP